MTINDAVRALFVPFQSGDITLLAESRVLWLNAQDGGQAHLATYQCVAQQSFRPWALPLTAEPVIPDGLFDAVLLCGRKQQDENRGLLATALMRLRPGGMFVVAAENDAGGRRLAKDLEQLGVKLNAESKYHCRILWGRVDDFNREQAQIWREAADWQQKEIAGQKLWTRPGLFGWDRLDKGSEFLLQNLPDNLSGAGADLGCGLGVLTQHIIAHHPKVKSVLAVDAEAEAVAATARNVPDPRVTTLWAAVGAEELPVKNLDWVIMNPPFHQGSRTAIGEGVLFIKAAARLLHTGGRLWMVANAHLPYEATLVADFRRVDKIAEAHGFKIYCAVK